MNEEITSCSIYRKDIKKVDKIVSQKNFKNRAEALRICIEFAEAHKVFA